jgi:peptide/nickel transport system substrate-binding protein
LQNAEIDWWDFAQVDLVPLLKSDPNIKLGISDLTGSVGYIRFNHLQSPFNNVLMRRAVLAAVNQETYMRAVTGNDPSSYQLCQSMFPCGTPYATNVGASRMPGSLDAAKKLMQQAGYKGEKVVLLSPSDNPQIAPFGDVAYDMLKKMGVNVELVATDFGTLLQRRANKGPVDQGGWSIFVLRATGDSVVNPLVIAPMRGQGAGGYAGWYQSAKMEQLAQDWAQATDAASQAKISDQMQDLAFDDVPSVPLGLSLSNNAYRANLTDLVPGPAPFFWNVRRA